MSDPRMDGRAGVGRRACLTGGLIVLLLLPGCAMALRFGRMPDLVPLESQLEPGRSTREDVRAALGEPRGSGRVFFPSDREPRDVWYYYYEEATTKEAQRIFLYVFFNEDRYGGYMWFSSLPGAGSFVPEVQGERGG